MSQQYRRDAAPRVNFRDDDEEEEEELGDEAAARNDENNHNEEHNAAQPQPTAPPQDDGDAPGRLLPFLVESEKLLRVGDVANTALVRGNNALVQLRPRRGDSSMESGPGGVHAGASARRESEALQQSMRASASANNSGALNASSASPSPASVRSSSAASASASQRGGGAGVELMQSGAALSISPMRAPAASFHQYRKQAEAQLAEIERRTHEQASSAGAAAGSAQQVLVPERLRRVSPYRSGWCQMRPTDAEQLEHAEKIILSPLRGRYVQQMVRPAGINTISFVPPDHILDALHTQLQNERHSILSVAGSNNDGGGASGSSKQSGKAAAGMRPVTVRHLVFAHGMGGGVGMWLPTLKHFADLADLLNSAVVFGTDDMLPRPEDFDDYDDDNGDEHQQQHGSNGGADSASASAVPRSKHERIFAQYLRDTVLDEVQRLKLVDQRRRREIVIVHALDMPGFARSEREDVDFEGAIDATEYMCERLSSWADKMEFHNVARWVSTRLPKIPMVVKKQRRKAAASSAAAPEVAANNGNNAPDASSRNDKNNNNAPDNAAAGPAQQQQLAAPDEGLRRSSSWARRGAAAFAPPSAAAAGQQEPHYDDDDGANNAAASSTSAPWYRPEHQAESLRRARRSQSMQQDGAVPVGAAAAASSRSINRDSPILWHGHGASTRSNASTAVGGGGGSSENGGGGGGSRTHTPARVRIGGAPFRLLSDRRAVKIIEQRELEQSRRSAAAGGASVRSDTATSVRRVNGNVDEDDGLVDCDEDDFFNEAPPDAALDAARDSRIGAGMPPLAPASNAPFILPDSPEHAHPSMAPASSSTRPTMPRPGSPEFDDVISGRRLYEQQRSEQSSKPQLKGYRRAESPPPPGVHAARRRSLRQAQDDEDEQAAAMAVSAMAKSRVEVKDRFALPFEPPLGPRASNSNAAASSPTAAEPRFSNVTVLAHSYGAYLFGQLACWQSRFGAAAAAAASNEGHDDDEQQQQHSKTKKPNAAINGDWIDHLVLLDPWGLPPVPPPDDEEFHSNIPCLFKCAACCFTCCDVLPLSVLRRSGPWGPSLLPNFRGDFAARWSSIIDDVRVFNDYCYHANAQLPASGEVAIKRSTEPNSMGFAADALAPILMDHLPDGVHLSVVYGDKTFMAKDVGFEVVEVLRGKRNKKREEQKQNQQEGVGELQYSVVPMAGHQLCHDSVFAANLMLTALLRL